MKTIVRDIVRQAPFVYGGEQQIGDHGRLQVVEVRHVGVQLREAMFRVRANSRLPELPHYRLGAHRTCRFVLLRDMGPLTPKSYDN